MPTKPNRQLPTGPRTVNEEWFDGLVRHQIHMLRFSGSVRNRIFKLLDATEADIAEKIRERLATMDPTGATPRNIKRAEVLSRVVKNIRVKAWKDVNETLMDEMVDFSMQEVEFADRAVKTVAPVTLNTSMPDPELLRSVATSRPFQGRTLREWAQKIQQDDLDRIDGAIKVGVVQGETNQQIARRVVGTARLRGADGVTQITRNNATALTRTAANHIGNQARRAYYEENDDLFEEEQYVSTLDSRTTPRCRALDGQKFPLGRGPIPPLHYQCRSTRVPVLAGDTLGDRPAKASTERQLTREFTEQQGLKRVTRRADLPRGYKGRYDEFKRKRVRELTGTVPGKVTYQDWLSRQSVEFQEDVLGKTKARLFREGQLPLTRFVNRQGDELTLAQMARRDAAAFRRAGLDPTNHSGPVGDSIQAARIRSNMVEIYGEQRLADQSGSVRRRMARELPEDAPELNLADHELMSLDEYTQGKYNLMNQRLRGKGVAGSENHADALNASATEGLRKLPDFEGDVFRGVNVQPHQIDQLMEHYQPGRVVTEAAFTSTSTRSRAAFAGSIRFVIKSKHGKDVSRLSNNPFESEVLFAPNTSFRVLDLKRKKGKHDSKLEIFMEEVDG